ncbi:hypothetical protein Ssi03_50440 [Sphaerisporangium siamense]|uniref:Uncharacterized protein n=1 Tax=Sphaerisporangium siamense TaxID=795645 RepID=A0A7W7D8L8_9ACTN|nr:hypothetical protein [Sphaerisporangium siamense]MBB4702252.1 hypothetical protein [Sphaerisporangium siamense]GII87054.1 hypothetical protein Ssi03_50440 [Sphaerisporangium siamense]
MPRPDPDEPGITYGEKLRRKGLQIRPRGWTDATRDQHAFGRRADGVRWKRTRDQLGHDTTEHADDRVDVQINLR